MAYRQSSNRLDQASLITGTDGADTFNGTGGRDSYEGAQGDDLIYGNAGDDSLSGETGFDVLYGGDGNDNLTGGANGDFVYGGRGADVLFGDAGYDALKGTDYSADRLDGSSGTDRLVQSEGNDVMTGGGGTDQFLFRYSDPMVGLAFGTGRAFTAITDFRSADDQLVFDAAGVGKDRSADVNFVDGGAADGIPGGKAATFFSGAAADSNGQAVMVLTQEEFLTGADAVLAAQGEANGDLILYYNETAGIASLLVVDGPDAAHSIARFTDITSVEDLAAAGFDANDFLFV